MQIQKKDIDGKVEKEHHIKAMICQMDWSMLTYENAEPLYKVKKNNYLDCFINDITKIAYEENVNLLVFPECTIPKCYENQFLELAKNTNMIIVAGTHYEGKDDGVYSICPIITSEGVFEQYKINPSPLEKSPIPSKGLRRGNECLVFKNTVIGNFAVIICIDYEDVGLKRFIELENLDLVIIPAFNKQNEEFANRMQSDIKDSKNGLYILYSNVLKGAECGKSAVFACMYEGYARQLKSSGLTDLVPEYKVYELKENQRYVIVNLDMTNKRPSVTKNINTDPNVEIYLEDTIQNSKMDKFLRAIGTSAAQYKNMAELYVKPKEYNDIYETLNNKNVVMIVGDPGIGKTYTAINLLYDFYQKGYSIKWITGLKKEDRELLRIQLLDYEPDDNEIIYFEDPFGRTQFENMDDLNQFFLPIVKKVEKSKAKIIITSRSQVYECFAKETNYANKLEAYKSEMNILHPSYTVESLNEIARRYVDYFYSMHKNKPAILKVLENEIKHRRLITPFMIYNVICDCKENPNTQQIVSAIQTRQDCDIIAPFAKSIKELDVSSKIFLYSMILQYQHPVKDLFALYRKGCNRTKETYSFLPRTETSLINQHDNYRISKVRYNNVYSYRFAHPVYEESCFRLAVHDTDCSNIFQNLFVELLDMDRQAAVKFFARCANCHLDMCEILLDYLCKDKAIITDLEARVIICSRIAIMKGEKYRKYLNQILPMADLINLLNEGSYNISLTYKLLSLLKRRANELETCSATIKWENIFNKNIIKQSNGTILFECLYMAKKLNPNLMERVSPSLNNYQIKRHLLALREDTIRNRFCEMLKGTLFEHSAYNVLEDIKTFEKAHKGEKHRITARKFLLTETQPKGIVWVDNGAMQALRRGARLFPIGVQQVTGSFMEGDVVRIKCQWTKYEYLSIVEISSDLLYDYKGKRTDDIRGEIGDALLNTCVSNAHRRMRLSRKNCLK